MTTVSQQATFELGFGQEQEVRERLSQGLSRMLANTYALYLKSQNYHWNVTGPMFHSLHELFEVHYTEMAGAIDEIAERIRSLGSQAPGTFSQFLDLSEVPEDQPGEKLNSSQMLRNLIQAHSVVVNVARELSEMASEVGDEPTADLMIQRTSVHEKSLWMLRSILDE